MPCHSRPSSMSWTGSGVVSGSPRTGIALSKAASIEAATHIVSSIDDRLHTRPNALHNDEHAHTPRQRVCSGFPLRFREVLSVQKQRGCEGVAWRRAPAKLDQYDRARSSVESTAYGGARLDARQGAGPSRRSDGRQSSAPSPTATAQFASLSEQSVLQKPPRSTPSRDSAAPTRKVVERRST